MTSEPIVFEIESSNSSVLSFLIVRGCQSFPFDVTNFQYIYFLISNLTAKNNFGKWNDANKKRESARFSKEYLLSSSKGCKVVVCQSLKMIWSSITPTRAALIWFEFGCAAGFFSDLQLWQLVILQPSDLQRLTVPLLKELKLFCWLNVCSRD